MWWRMHAADSCNFSRDNGRNVLRCCCRAAIPMALIGLAPEQWRTHSCRARVRSSRDTVRSCILGSLYLVSTNQSWCSWPCGAGTGAVESLDLNWERGEQWTYGPAGPKREAEEVAEGGNGISRISEGGNGFPGREESLPDSLRILHV